MDRRTLTCEETEELLPEFTLGVLEVGEAAAVTRHLQGCHRHADSLSGYDAVGEGLCLSVPPVYPPSQLKARLMARVSAPARVPRRDRRLARIGWAAAALAAMLAIVLGVWGLSLRRQIDDQVARREEFMRVVTQTDAHMVPLETTEAGGVAKGVIIYTDSQAAVWAVGLPVLQGDQVYQCWWISADNQRVSGGTFRPEGGVSIWLMLMPADTKNFRKIGITIEPNGGNPQPQGPKVMGADL